MEQIERTLERLNQKYIWDNEPVFCFTSDIDWASESVMQKYFELLEPYNLPLTLFCTHESKEIIKSRYEKGIHPNFLPRSSQRMGEMNDFNIRGYYDGIIQNCLKIVPDADVFRSHRAFSITDICHLLKEKYHFAYCSNDITIMQTGIKPVLHESGLINFPVFFEDGTHLYNKLDFDFKKYLKYFTSPGIKIISFHPMHFVFNSPDFMWMRNLKDSMTSIQYQNLVIEKLHEASMCGGIRNTIIDIIEFAKSNYKIYSLKELYEMV